MVSIGWQSVSWGVANPVSGKSVLTHPQAGLDPAAPCLCMAHMQIESSCYWHEGYVAL